MHLHGFRQRVIAKDGRPVPQPDDADTVNVAPGERHILSHAESKRGMHGMVTAVIVRP